MFFVTKSDSVRLDIFLLSRFFFIILVYGTSNVIANSDVEGQTINIGAIVHVDSRVGREQKTAMEMAVEDFNADSKNQKLSIHYRNGSSENPLQSAFTAQELIQEKQAQVIIGLGEWQETALLADVGNRFRVPSISLLASDINPPFISLRWPYLIQMGRNDSEQVQWIADLVSLNQWRRVIVIYENEPYGGDSGSLVLLSKALLDLGSNIEYVISLPPLAPLLNPKEAVKEELSKFISKKCYSRVFIVLHLSQTLASHLFVEAKEKEITGKESAWIITESIVDYFPSLDASTLSSMEGALGLKTINSTSSESFQLFQARFWSIFSKEYPEERDPVPGFHALQAYDAVIAIGKATNHFPRKGTSKMLEYVLSTNFSGLSGRIYFEEGRLAPQDRSYRLVNVVNKDLVPVGLWTAGLGFPFASKVNWPGGLNGVAPKGWVMPTIGKNMTIGIPAMYAFTNFVDVVKHNYTGFCIELFREAVNILPYDLPFTLVPFHGLYSELVECVYNKTFDAAVGDFTSLSSRTDIVEFTQPFAESGLAMILPVKPNIKNKGWIFVMPFKRDLWIATLGILIYTMLIVWFLEHRSNPEFRGPLKDQLSTAMWFTFSSIFFAQREGIRSSYTRAVLVVWFFVVLILTQSYTADLSSMLTAARLKQNETDIETLVTKDAKVGCHAKAFTEDFLENVLKFKKENIVPVQTNLKFFHDNFVQGNITAAFLEIPYARLFKNQYCNDYTMTISNYRFGGLSFVFPKGSPIAVDVSRAILTLTETGNLTKLEDKWLNMNKKCSMDESDQSNTNDAESLTLKSFWGLFVLSAATSTLCLLASLIPVIRKYRQYLRESNHILNDIGETPLSFASYILQGESRNLAINVRNNSGAFNMGRQRWVFRNYEVRDSE